MDFQPFRSPYLLGFLYLPLLAVALCMVLHYLVYWRRTAQWRKSNIPFLPPSFLIGHKYFWNMINNSCLVSIDRIYKENSDKDIVGFFLATMPMVLIRNPVLIKQIFARNFEKTFETGWAAPRGGQVTQHMPSLCANKKAWKSSRNALTPMFTTSRVSGERFAKISDQIPKIWAHVERARTQGRPICVKQTSLKFITDVSLSSFFGLDADSNQNQNQNQGEVHQMVENFAEPGLGKLLSVFSQMHFQGAQIFESLKFVTQEQIDSMTSLIETQMKERIQTKRFEDDLIDILIGLKKEDKDNELKSGVTSEMIGLGLAILFGLVRTDDATAFLATSVIHLLSLHPQHQQRIRGEITQAMMKHNTTEFTYAVVKDLHFLDQCIKESARLYPNMPALTRICTEDFKVDGTDYTIKKGERLIIDPYSIQHDPKYFQNPDEFDPDRFSPEKRGEIDPKTLLGFGSGPRKCPGYNIGLLMISTLIGGLLHRYELKALSHKKQVDAYDFHSRSYNNTHTYDIFIDVVPQELMRN